MTLTITLGKSILFYFINIFPSKPFFSVRNEINSERSCIQLSPASKAAQWKIYTKNIPVHKHHVSLATTEGIFLMGAYGSKGVTLVKPDGTNKWGIFFLKRFIK